MKSILLLCLVFSIECSNKKDDKDNNKLNIPPLDLSIIKKAQENDTSKKYTREELLKIKRDYFKKLKHVTQTAPHKKED